MSSPQWYFGSFRLDLAHACLWREAEPVSLPPKVFDVLHYLVTHPDRVVTKDELLDAVWPDTAVSDAVVRVAIGTLRKALGETSSPPQYIATVPRRGYRFVAPVTAVAPSTPEPTETLLFPAAPAPLTTPVTETCRRCGQVVPLPATWCHGCGQRLEAEAPALPAAPSPAEATTLLQAVGAPPGPRLATPIAPAVPPTGAALFGERKQVTVLCTDIRGTQELLHDFDSEVVQQLLEPALQAMIEAVRRYGGTVHQVQGDGVMALFGAPLAQEDHAIRACYAALAIQTALRVAADDVRRAYGRPVQCGIGLHAGEVVLRAMRHDLPQEYSVLGQTAYLAVCMEQLAPPETILLTAATMRLVEGAGRGKSWGPMPVKGMAEPVEVWELLGVSDRRWRLQTARARGLTRFVGRQTELSALHAALTQAGAGRGQLVALIGEAGLGKSRLVDEFLQAVSAEGWRVLDSAAVSYGQGTPYFPLLDLLRRYCHLEERDDVRTVGAKVTERVLTLDAALQDTIPPLLTLLDASPADSHFGVQLDAQQGRQLTLAALKRVLVRESQVQPVLLVVEDLHWLDTETQALLDSLVESLPTARLLLLVTYRPEYRHGWGSKTYYTQVRLDPLPLAGTEAFLQSLLGQDPSLIPLTPLLVQRTEGNPFFLEESVRTLVETGALVGEPGAYRLAQGLPALHMPATVHAVLAARIDRLAPDAKQVLQTAAVLGMDIPLPVLQAVAEVEEAALHRGLTQLQDAEFLYETRLFPERAYTFKHALTQEVAYGILLREQRRTLHARVVEALEVLAVERVAEQVDRLAYHALRGEVWDKALTYCRQAGDRAMTQPAYREAAEYFEQALHTLVHLPDTRDIRQQAIDLRLALVPALSAMGAYGQSLILLDEAEALSRTLADRARLGQVLTALANEQMETGDHARAIAVGEQAHELAATLSDSALQARASYTLGRAYRAVGDFGRSATLLRQNVEAAERESGTLSTELRIRSQASLALTLSVLGAFTEGRHHGEEALRLARLAGRGSVLIMAHGCLGLLYLGQGNLAHAIPVLEQSLTLCRTSGNLDWFQVSAAGLGAAYVFSGCIAVGRALLEEASRETIGMGALGNHSRWAVWLSEACRLAADREEAWQHARRGLALAQQQKARWDEAYALHQLGVVQAHAEAPDAAQAEAYYQQALALAEELGMRPLQAHCHLGLGTLYARTGRPAQAHAALTTAMAMYRAMEMTFWLPQNESSPRQ